MSTVLSASQPDPDDDPERAIAMVRAWLVNSLPRTRRARIATDDTIVASFRQFQAAKPRICATAGKDRDRLTFVEDADLVVQ